MTCKKEHSDIQNLLALLPNSQGGPGRHKCAACAFEEGYTDGIKGIKREIDSVLENLPEGQAKNQRHKSCEAAYEKGFEIATKVKAVLNSNAYTTKDGKNKIVDSKKTIYKTILWCIDNELVLKFDNKLYLNEKAILKNVDEIYYALGADGESILVNLTDGSIWKLDIVGDGKKEVEKILKRKLQNLQK